MATKRIGREEIYKGKIFTVVKDTIQFDNGQTAKWDLVVHNGASAVVPLTKDNEVILVRQYRHAEDGEVLEIPAGKLEKGEDPLVCAKRELEEETGKIAGNIEKICEMYAAIGFSDEKLHLYIATELQDGMMQLDEDEFIDIKKYPLSQAVEMIYSGIIKDSKTIVGLLAARDYVKN